MKLFRGTPIFIKGILIAGMLSACQNENDTAIAPQAPTSTSDQNARIALAAGTLIKDGNVDLSYNSQSILPWKETYPNGYNVFVYAPQLITVKGYKYGVPATETKYTLDASGRCVQTVTNWATYIYEYNASGQLSACYNKFKPKERRQFTYAPDAIGWKKSLSIVSFYDEFGVRTKELLFGYGGASGIPDNHPLNPDVLPSGISKYLPIFGSFNSYLVTCVLEDKYASNGQKTSSNKYFYSYTLDYAGKANNITIKRPDGTLVSSTDRKYFTPKF
ncbi:hypothetical protein [Dyadobacter sp. 676]|uniref:DUF4595 domain-containing protein n=1 Tax=Dyadobacter sp. 676 TaxID=3088362 RepID=A0AAU8FSE1_9BACT